MPTEQERPNMFAPSKPQIRRYQRPLQHVTYGESNIAKRSLPSHPPNQPVRGNPPLAQASRGGPSSPPPYPGSNHSNVNRPHPHAPLPNPLRAHPVQGPGFGAHPSPPYPCDVLPPLPSPSPYPTQPYPSAPYPSQVPLRDTYSQIYPSWAPGFHQRAPQTAQSHRRPPLREHCVWTVETSRPPIPTIQIQPPTPEPIPQPPPTYASNYALYKTVLDPIPERPGCVPRKAAPVRKKNVVPAVVPDSRTRRSSAPRLSFGWPEGRRSFEEEMTELFGGNWRHE